MVRVEPRAMPQLCLLQRPGVQPLLSTAHPLYALQIVPYFKTRQLSVILDARQKSPYTEVEVQSLKRF